MKIARYRLLSGDRYWGVLDDSDWTVRPFLSDFPQWAPGAAQAATTDEFSLGDPIPAGDVVLLAPFAPGARVFGTGINYGSHLLDAKRSNAAHPPTPPG